MPDIFKIADEAELIVNGYAFTKCREGFRILNLNRPDKALVISTGRGYIGNDNGRH